MKASELIRILAELKAKHGDIEVRIVDCWDDEEIRRVEFEDVTKWRDIPALVIS